MRAPVCCLLVDVGVWASQWVKKCYKVSRIGREVAVASQPDLVGSKEVQGADAKRRKICGGYSLNFSPVELKLQLVIVLGFAMLWDSNSNTQTRDWPFGLRDELNKTPPAEHRIRSPFSFRLHFGYKNRECNVKVAAIYALCSVNSKEREQVSKGA